MKPRYSISIVTYTALEHARRCVAAVMAHSRDYELILTANGSANAAWFFKKLALEFKHVRVVENAVNQGFWRPHNHALTLAQGDFFVCLNDDVLVPKGWLEDLNRPFRYYKRAALCCPDGGCSELDENFRGRRGRHEYCEGACLMARTETVREQGLFSELPGLAYGEDSDLSLKLREAGYTLHWVPVAIVHPHGSTSRYLPEARVWMDINHAYLREKWSEYLKTRRFACEPTDSCACPR